ncbi:CvpA family protein [Verrucomicrobiota bacterium sgz303538]
MAESTSDPWQLIFFGGAALLVALQALRGWHLGVVRQIVQLLAIAGSYASAWIASPHLVPVLQPLGYPNFILRAAGGACVGLFVYLVVSVLGAILFKKTSDQNVGVVRMGYGLAGAGVGMLFGFVVVWAVSVGIRFLGTLAEAEIQSSRNRASNSEARASAAKGDTRGWVRGLAGMKHSLEQGPAGGVVQQLDPIPGTLYTAMQKIALMIANEQSVSRFMSYPGVKPLAEHPKIRALQSDPQVAREATAQDFMALLKNPKIVAAANDPDVLSLIQKVEFEKALDYALGKPEKPHSAPLAR